MELMNKVMLLVGLITFVTYVSYIWGKYGIQKSISISFFELPTKYSYTFRLYIWLLSLSIITSGLTFNNNMLIISGCLLSFVGIFTKITTKWKFIIHMIGAIGGILSAYIGVLIENLNIGLAISFETLILIIWCWLFLDRKHIIWNIEIVCFANLITGILIISNM